MNVTVTQEDIDGGLPELTLECPVARALERAYGMQVEVEYTDLHWWSPAPPHSWHEIPSRRVQQFIADFDAGKPVKPFTFRTRRPRR